MEHRLFDHLTRALAHGQSRRRLAGLGGLASLGLVTGLGLPGESDPCSSSSTGPFRPFCSSSLTGPCCFAQ